MKSIRKGKTVVTVDDQGATTDLRTYDSINAAKKANGLNARTLRPGESFPKRNTGSKA